ncbi:hypothetical protein [Actinospongicola halichondriae]|uniref:hypothetical protein n=1 Tax=Actinospongicola halichondriae TaxID=3236844 RepID=UPI003D531CF9
MRTTTLRTLTLAAALVGLAACGSAGDDDQVSADGATTTVAVTDVDATGATATPGSDGANADGGDSDQSDRSSTQSGTDTGQPDSNQSGSGSSDAEQPEAGSSDDSGDALDPADSADPAGSADDVVDPEPEPEADYSGNPYWSPGLEHKATYRVPVHRGSGDPIEQCLAKGGNPYYNPDAPGGTNTSCSTGRNGRWDHPVPDYDPTIGALDTEIECAWKDAEHVRSKSLSQGKPSVQTGYKWIVYNPSEQVCGSR